jgi:hypothetical protein
MDSLQHLYSVPGHSLDKEDISKNICFQILDSTISGADIRFEDNNNYTLSVFRKKVISGKYFCEPKLII